MSRAPRGSGRHRLGVVTGLASEAAVLVRMLAETSLQVRVVCAGADSKAAARLTRQLIAEEAEVLLSFGVAGALAPDLEGGEVIVAERVRDPAGEDYPTDAAWRAALTAKLTEVAFAHREGAILGNDGILRQPADKAAAFQRSGCLAVDTESAAVARAAAQAGLPFLAVRAIADRAGDGLPALVENAVKPDGRPAVVRTLAALMRHPGDIGATLRLARRTELALARLRMLEAAKEPLLGRF